MSDNVQTELEEELPPVQIKQWVSISGGLLHPVLAQAFFPMVLSSEPQWEDLIAVFFLSAIRQI